MKQEKPEQKFLQKKQPGDWNTTDMQKTIPGKQPSFVTSLTAIVLYPSYLISKIQSLCDLQLKI